MSQRDRAIELEEADDSSGDDDNGNRGMKRKDSCNEDNECKRAERRAANRRSAFQSRQRRKILIEDLQKTVTSLSKDNQDLRNSNNQLRAKLETAMLENQLLRKQQGGTSSSNATDGAASGPSDSKGKDVSSITSDPFQVAANNTNSQHATIAPTSTPRPESAPTSSTTMISASQEVNSAFMGINNCTASQVAAGSQGHPAASQLLGASNQGISPHLLNALGSLGTATLSSGVNPDLAARLVLAGASGGLSGMNNIGNESAQQRQSSLVANPGVATTSLGLGCGQLQQLAILLGASLGRSATPDQGQQHLALLQAALGHRNPPVSQFLWAQSGGQADQTTPTRN